MRRKSGPSSSYFPAHYQHSERVLRKGKKQLNSTGGVENQNPLRNQKESSIGSLLRWDPFVKDGEDVVHCSETRSSFTYFVQKRKKPKREVFHNKKSLREEEELFRLSKLEQQNQLFMENHAKALIREDNEGAKKKKKKPSFVRKKKKEKKKRSLLELDYSNIDRSVLQRKIVEKRRRKALSRLLKKPFESVRERAKREKLYHKQLDLDDDEIIKQLIERDRKDKRKKKKKSFIGPPFVNYGMNNTDPIVDSNLLRTFSANPTKRSQKYRFLKQRRRKTVNYSEWKKFFGSPKRRKSKTLNHLQRSKNHEQKFPFSRSMNVGTQCSSFANKNDAFDTEGKQRPWAAYDKGIQEQLRQRHFDELYNYQKLKEKEREENLMERDRELHRLENDNDNDDDDEGEEFEVHQFQPNDNSNHLNPRFYKGKPHNYTSFIRPAGIKSRK